MKLFKKKSSLIILSILSLFFIYQIFLKTEPKIVLEKIKIEQIANYPLAYEFDGRFYSSQESFLSVRKGGKLDRLSVTSGQTVKKDDVLAIVDEVERSTNAKVALAKYSKLKKERQRTNILFQRNSATREELDEIQANYDSAKAELEKAKDNLADAIIKAPYDGIIGPVSFRQGDIVPDGARLFSLINLSEKKTLFKVNKELAEKLPENPSIVISSLEQKQSFEFKAHLETAIPGSRFSALGKEFYLSFEDPLKKIQLNNTYNIRIIVSEDQNFIKLPKNKLLSLEGKQGVLLLNENNLKFQELDLINSNLLSSLDRGYILSSNNELKGKPVFPKNPIDLKLGVRAILKRKKIEVSHEAQ